MIGKYFMNLLLSLDQLGNSILAGDPDETISSRLGRIKTKYNGTIPWTRPVSKLTAYLLHKIDKNHVEDAIEPTEGNDGIIDNRDTTTTTTLLLLLLLFLTGCVVLYAPKAERVSIYNHDQTSSNMIINQDIPLDAKLMDTMMSVKGIEVSGNNLGNNNKGLEAKLK